VKIIYILTGLAFLYYLYLPLIEYPDPIDLSYQSSEPADIESPNRKGYYVDSNRNQIITHYRKEFYNPALGFYPFRLNYPPEESKYLIRDQTMSTFLEELVYPMRESIYINGFEPRKDTEKIIISGKEWKAKVIVRYVGSEVFARILVGILVLLFIPLLAVQAKLIFREFFGVLGLYYGKAR